MQSSYSVIKKVYADIKEEKSIETLYGSDVEKICVDNNKEERELLLIDIQKERENILKKAKDEADIILREAYEEGYRQGNLNGLEDSKKASSEIIKNTNIERGRILDDANRILEDAKKQYEEYLEEKKDEILTLSLHIAKMILKREIDVNEGIIAIAEDGLNGAKDEKNIIIKCNILDRDLLERERERLKKTLNIRGDIFLLESDIDRGNIVIEKRDGIIKAGIEEGLLKIKEEIL